MVEDINLNKNDYYKCSVCSFFYKEKKLAQRCEDFCKEHKGCNLEITKRAIKIN